MNNNKVFGFTTIEWISNEDIIGDMLDAKDVMSKS